MSGKEKSQAFIRTGRSVKIPFTGAKYKAFKSLDTSQKAFTEGYELHWGQETKFESDLSEEQLEIICETVYLSISVDAAWNTDTLGMEYQRT